jgi:quinol monooxygenase YgiN
MRRTAATIKGFAIYRLPESFIERYLDRAAMDRHNNSAAVARFFGIAKPMIDGEVTLVTGTELSAKSDD